MFKCVHISDIHFRSLKRHDEFKLVFESMFDKIKNIKNLDLIFIGGDIVHSKTQGITPEIIDLLTWWFTSLASIAPTHIILGNHDGLMLNKDRQDAISPIINALDNKNLYLYKKSGVYKTGIPGFNWCVFSCFDEENWSNVKPIKDEINIACFHGAVRGSKTDISWEIEGEVNVSFFDGFDFGFLGDIHKFQYLDLEKRIAYPGSVIQQNYGESVLKGFLIWDIKNKNDFTSKLVTMDNPYAFITIDWRGTVEDTILFISKVKKGLRYRIRSDKTISQAEIKLLHHYLKYKKEASEIVYQVVGNDKDDNTKENFVNGSSYNIRIKEDRIKLLNDYYESISQDTINKLDSIFSKTLDRIPQNLKDVYGQKWSINSMKFDNTFSYGKDNYINFDNMNGIVGLFGNNRSGKSSIPGTLMYTLFNTSDRGAIKNQDIINIRKGSCKSAVKITIGAEKYLIERETVKKTNKKNITTATTNLNLTFLNEQSNENEEQRRETEKVLKRLIGTPDDFLYTSFASQGEMNTFVKERNSARKSILSKFLNINIYEELYKESREDYIVLKNKLNAKKEKDWNDLILNNLNSIQLNNIKIIELEEKTSVYRTDLIKLNVELNSAKQKTKNHPSGYTNTTASNEKLFLDNKLKNLENDKKDLIAKINNAGEVLKKIKLFKEDFSINDLRNEKERLYTIEKKLQNLKSLHNISVKSKNNIKDELKILDQVPCGNSFLSCKFIKKAHEGKTQIKEVTESILNLEGDILEINNIVKNIRLENIDEKIAKFDNINKKEYKTNVDKESFELKRKLKEDEIDAVLIKLSSLMLILKDIKELNVDEYAVTESNIQSDIDNLQNTINDNTINILNSNKNIFKLEEEINNYKKEKKDYHALIEEFKMHDLFSSCVSKKGIPTMLIKSYLPKINKEINAILSGVVSFKLFLEECEKGNNLNVYIDYGDSKRIIECASGMEKMIASIAIRVALINISSLAKSDVFIIDEGFGSLDDSNVEACSRLLNSLKKYFKSIIIISHIDAIKDVVDKNIEIIFKGNDSYVRFE